MSLPTDAQARKAVPIASGVLDYFPDALIAVAALSKAGNDQHNPGKPLHWDRDKSGDEGDALLRHFIDRGTVDTDGIRHSAKVAWRALALLQKELEEAEHLPLPRGARKSESTVEQNKENDTRKEQEAVYKRESNDDLYKALARAYAPVQHAPGVERSEVLGVHQERPESESEPLASQVRVLGEIKAHIFRRE